MLFNSYEFIFGFLPIVAVVFFLLGAKSKRSALVWLSLASLFFYAWWRPTNLLIIVPSICANFLFARLIMRLNHSPRRFWSNIVLALGIAFDIGILGYFKYANFFVEVANDIAGTSFVLYQIILPLGISFITFQKIAFLIDVHGRRVDSVSFQEFVLFVLFFPQLIAGPIVHFREMMPQFRRLPCARNDSDLAVGVTLFFIGLFKKVVLADGIAPSVSLIFEHASSGSTLSFFSAWMGAIGFTLQIYFDFSGYTDMAMGAARLFGIRLPPNFDSPLRATNIIDFWSRWHITLTRFLTAYVYNPLSILLARRRHRSERSRTVSARISTFLQVLAVPTLFTMLLSGLWHGAGYLFVLWGLTHGLFLILNHAWRSFGPTYESKVSVFAMFVLTSLCIVASMVLFRSPTMLTAARMFEGMLGLNGISLPESVIQMAGPFAQWMTSAGVSVGLEIDLPFKTLSVWLVGLTTIALVFPNSLEILRAHQPAVGWRENGTPSSLKTSIVWTYSLFWSVTIALIAVTGILQIQGESEFLYWQF